MSSNHENIKTKTKMNSATTAFDVTRNGVTITFSPTEFSRGQRKKDGITYPSPGDVSNETESVIKSWLGEENWFGMINAALRQWFISTFDAVLESNKGEYNEALAIQYLQELSTRGETIAEINAKIQEVYGKLQAVAEKLTAAQASNDALAMAGCMTEFLALSNESKKLQVVLNSKKRVPKTKEEAEDSEPAAVVNA